MPLHLLCTSCDFTHLCLPAAKKCSHPSFNFFLFDSKIIHDWHGMILPSVTSCEKSFKKILCSLIIHVNCIFVAVNSITIVGILLMLVTVIFPWIVQIHWQVITTSTGPESGMTNVCTIVEKSFDGKFYFLPWTFLQYRTRKVLTHTILITFMYCTLYSKRHFSMIMILRHILVQPSK